MLLSVSHASRHSHKGAACTSLPRCALRPTAVLTAVRSGVLLDLLVHARRLDVAPGVVVVVVGVRVGRGEVRRGIRLHRRGGGRGGGQRRWASVTELRGQDQWSGVRWLERQRQVRRWGVTGERGREGVDLGLLRCVPDRHHRRCAGSGCLQLLLHVGLRVQRCEGGTAEVTAPHHTTTLRQHQSALASTTSCGSSSSVISGTDR